MAVRFDLDTVAPPDRRDTLDALMSLLPVPIDVRTRTLDELSVTTTSDFFGDLFMVSCDGRGALVGRDDRRVRQDHPRKLFLSVVAHGRSILEQNGVASMISIGDIVVYSSTSAYRATFDRVGKHTYMVDYDALRLPDHVLHAQLARRIDASNPLGPVVSSYLSRLATHAIDLDADRRAELERPTLDLLRSMLTAVAGDDSRSREPLHESLGVRIMEYMRLHLADRALSVASVARHHHISERYTYLILAKFGVTFADWVREHRLQGAAVDLGDPRSTESISSIAFRWGFPDHANFTRAFRRRYGTTPSAFRRDALGARRPG